MVQLTETHAPEGAGGRDGRGQPRKQNPHCDVVKNQCFETLISEVLTLVLVFVQSRHSVEEKIAQVRPSILPVPCAREGHLQLSEEQSVLIL